MACVPRMGDNSGVRVPNLKERVVNECYQMEGQEQKIPIVNGTCLRKDKTESEGYVGGQTYMRPGCKHVFSGDLDESTCCS